MAVSSYIIRVKFGANIKEDIYVEESRFFTNGSFYITSCIFMRPALGFVCAEQRKRKPFFPLSQRALSHEGRSDLRITSHEENWKIKARQKLWR